MVHNNSEVDGVTEQDFGDDVPEARPSVDVVICAYTEDRWTLLGRAVASLQSQTTPPRRIIVCIDHNDGLLRRARAEWEAEPGQPPVTVLPNELPGRLGSARNTALLGAKADVVAFLDDDARAEPNWLERLLACYSDDGVQAVGGAPLPEFETHRPRWFPPEFDWVFGCHHGGLPTTRGTVRHLIGANMSARTAALRSIGGFHSDNHDDMDLSHRVAERFGTSSVVYEPRAVVWHFVPRSRVTWSYFWQRCFRVNRGKVAAYRDMGEAANLAAEIDFVRRVSRSTLQDFAALARGDAAGPARAGAILCGLALAAAGNLMGRLDLLRGVPPQELTTGLPSDAGVFGAA